MYGYTMRDADGDESFILADTLPNPFQFLEAPPPPPLTATPSQAPTASSDSQAPAPSPTADVVIVTITAGSDSTADDINTLTLWGFVAVLGGVILSALYGTWRSRSRDQTSTFPIPTDTKGSFEMMPLLVNDHFF